MNSVHFLQIKGVRGELPPFQGRDEYLLVETFKYLFDKDSCSEANDTPPQLEWEWYKIVGGVLNNTSSFQGAR
jgi:hypothetical protein